MDRVTVRITDEQRQALTELGQGDLSRGLRTVIADYLGIGPDDLPRGFAALEPARLKEISRSGGKARWPSSPENQLSNQGEVSE